MEIVRDELNSNLKKVIAVRDYHGNDIEHKALELYNCLYAVSKSNEKYIYMYIRITSNTNSALGLGVKLPRNFRIILLSSLRHLKLYDTQKFPLRTVLRIIAKDLLNTLDHLDFKSLYLFKVLDQVVLKKLELIDDIHQPLLSKLYETCHCSPVGTLRNLAVTLIHKIELKLGNGLKTFNPLKNITILTNNEETRIKLDQIKTEEIHCNLRDYMEFIHKYFHFNVYNKAAGILYKAVISRYEVEDFKIHIWPFWSCSFEKCDESRYI